MDSRNSGFEVLIGLHSSGDGAEIAENSIFRAGDDRGKVLGRAGTVEVGDDLGHLIRCEIFQAVVIVHVAVDLYIEKSRGETGEIPAFFKGVNRDDAVVFDLQGHGSVCKYRNSLYNHYPPFYRKSDCRKKASLCIYGIPRGKTAMLPPDFCYKGAESEF
jgi:hypothetical protein